MDPQCRLSYLIHMSLTHESAPLHGGHWLPTHGLVLGHPLVLHDHGYAHWHDKVEGVLGVK